MKCASPQCSNDVPSGQKYCSRQCAPFGGLSNRESKPTVQSKAGLTRDDIEQFQKRARYVARKNGRPELAEDFSQEVLLAITQGRTATVDQLFVDYLRKQFGRSGTPGGGARQMAASRTVSLDESVGEEGGSILRHELIGCPGGDRRDLGDRGGAAHLFSGIESEIYEMHFVEEKTLEEVGACFGVTESRIYQRVNSMRKRIREFFLSSRLLERYESDETFGVLEVQWLTI